MLLKRFMTKTISFIEKSNISNDNNNNGDPIKEQSDTDTDNEVEDLCKADLITNECFDFIQLVLKTLSYLKEFRREIISEFQDNREFGVHLVNVFSDIGAIESLYKLIFDKIISRKNDQSFTLPDLFLDQDVRIRLNIYKNFLNNYAINAKFIGDLNRDNLQFQEICANVRGRWDEMINLDSCLYTVFNSLFALSMLFNRYGKCFFEGHPSLQKAKDVEVIISDLLNDININQKQVFLAQKELNMLTGRSRDPKINLRFISKVIVTKLNRKEEKVHRQLVLFSDCLYVTTLPRPITYTCRIHKELSLNNMMVSIISEDDVDREQKLQWGVNLISQETDQNFYFENQASMTMWKDLLQSAIENDSDHDVNHRLVLGEMAPRWQKDSTSGYCNGFQCSMRFNTMIRRHHCRACGLLYCESCCSCKIKLKFSKSYESKVCRLCYRILLKDLHNSQGLAEAKRHLGIVFDMKMKKGIKTGWLEERVYNREKNLFNPPVKYFCELDSRDPYLNLYERCEDKFKHHGIMLLGMAIINDNESKYFQQLKSSQFVIEHEDKNEAYLFRASSAQYCEEWIKCLRDSIFNYFNDE